MTRKLPLPTLLAGCACVIAAGCGGSKSEPTQRDVEMVAASVSDVVYQCRAAQAGFIASPDGKALERDVDSLLDVESRVDLDARFTLPGRDETSLRDQLGLANRRLKDGCAPRQAERLQEAIDG